MSKYLILCFVGAVVSSYPSAASAQSSAPCQCGTVSSVPVVNNDQAYRRYSYAPTQTQPVTGTVIATAPMTYASPQYSAPGVAPQPVVSQPIVQNQSNSTQGYRRFSYQPSTSGVSTHHRQAWEYPKADSHRYRP